MKKLLIILSLLVSCNAETPERKYSVVLIALDGIRESEISRFPIAYPAGLVSTTYGQKDNCLSSHESRVSLPTYYTLLSGQPAPEIKDNRFNGKVPRETLLDEFDSLGITSWPPLKNIAGVSQLAKDRMEIVQSNWGKGDPEVYKWYKATLDTKRDFTFIHLTDADDAAHGSSWRRYIQNVETESIFATEIITQFELASSHSTYYFVVSDHGRGKGYLWTSHGRNIPGSEKIWVQLIGPGSIQLEVCSHLGVYKSIKSLLR